MADRVIEMGNVKHCPAGSICSESEGKTPCISEDLLKPTAMGLTEKIENETSTTMFATQTDHAVEYTTRITPPEASSTDGPATAFGVDETEADIETAATEKIVSSLKSVTPPLEVIKDTNATFSPPTDSTVLIPVLETSSFVIPVETIAVDDFIQEDGIGANFVPLYKVDNATNATLAPVEIDVSIENTIATSAHEANPSTASAISSETFLEADGTETAMITVPADLKIQLDGADNVSDPTIYVTDTDVSTKSTTASETSSTLQDSTETATVLVEKILATAESTGLTTATTISPEVRTDIEEASGANSDSEEYEDVSKELPSTTGRITELNAGGTFEVKADPFATQVAAPVNVEAVAQEIFTENRIISTETDVVRITPGHTDSEESEDVSKELPSTTGKVTATEIETGSAFEVKADPIATQVAAPANVEAVIHENKITSTEADAVRINPGDILAEKPTADRMAIAPAVGSTENALYKENTEKYDLIEDESILHDSKVQTVGKIFARISTNPSITEPVFYTTSQKADTPTEVTPNTAPTSTIRDTNFLQNSINTVMLFLVNLSNNSVPRIKENPDESEDTSLFKNVYTESAPSLKNGASTEETTTLGPPTTCTRFGRYPATNCKLYYQCVRVMWWYQLELKSCGEGQKFHAESMSCVPGNTCIATSL